MLMRSLLTCFGVVGIPPPLFSFYFFTRWCILFQVLKERSHIKNITMEIYFNWFIFKIRFCISIFFNDHLLDSLLEMCQREGLLCTTLITQGLKVFCLANPMEDISAVQLVFPSVTLGQIKRSWLILRTYVDARTTHAHAHEHAHARLLSFHRDSKSPPNLCLTHHF